MAVPMPKFPVNEPPAKAKYVAEISLHLYTVLVADLNDAIHNDVYEVGIDKVNGMFDTST
jgi:hypothetical protein